MNIATTEIPKREKTAQVLWTALILMFFVIQAIIWTIAITLTARDTSHAVVAGYDEQALKWDQVKEMRTASALLGWRATLEIEPKGDIRGNRVFNLSLSDQANQPIVDAKIQLTVFHRGRASETQDVVLEAIEPGLYRGKIVVQNSGIWRFSGSAKTADHEFLIEHQTTIDSNRNL